MSPLPPPMSTSWLRPCVQGRRQGVRAGVRHPPSSRRPCECSSSICTTVYSSDVLLIIVLPFEANGPILQPKGPTQIIANCTSRIVKIGTVTAVDLVVSFLPLVLFVRPFAVSPLSPRCFFRHRGTARARAFYASTPMNESSAASSTDIGIASYYINFKVCH